MLAMSTRSGLGSRRDRSRTPARRNRTPVCATWPTLASGADVELSANAVGGLARREVEGERERPLIPVAEQDLVELQDIMAKAGFQQLKVVRPGAQEALVVPSAERKYLLRLAWKLSCQWRAVSA